VRVLADGAIDVGLAARPLRAKERRHGLVQVPLARAAVAFAVASGEIAGDLSVARLAALYSGEEVRWSDGTPVRVLVRERGDSGMATIAAAWPDLAATMRAAAENGRAEVMFTDQQMRDALLSTPGAIGPVDAAMIALEASPLALPAIDGVSPTRQHLQDGSWPLQRTLFLLTAMQPPEPAAGFVELARSATVSDLFESVGLIRPDGAR